MINIWILVLVVVIFAATEINIDTKLYWLRSILIVVFSALVSLRLYKFAYTSYSVNSMTPNPFKLGLIIFISFLIILIPFIHIIQKMLMKRNRKITSSLPDEIAENGALETIFSVLFGIWMTLYDLVPSLQNVWIILIILSFIFFLWTFKNRVGKKDEE
jgi:hypothetical protein